MTRNIKPKITLERNTALQTQSDFKAKPWFSDFWFALFLIGYAFCIHTKTSFQPQHYQTVDGEYYQHLADKVMQGRPFVVDGLVNRQQRSFSPYPPGYPVLLAMGKWISRLSYARVAIWINVFLVGLVALLWRHFAPLWGLAVALCTDSVLELSCYTWSEFPFIICLIFIGLISSRIRFHPVYKWLFLALLSASFLLRFASVFLFFYIGILGLFFNVKVGNEENQDPENQINNYRIWRWLFLSYLSFALLYFGLETVFFGQPTGGDRYPNSESNYELLNALGIELLNQAAFFKDFAGSSMPSFTLGVLFQVFLILWVLLGGKRKQKPVEISSPGMYLIVVGLCYWAFIIPIRWYFYFAEPFDFRLMTPGGVLIFLGITCWFSVNYIIKWPKVILALFFAVSFFLSLPKKEMFARYQEWFWLENVKLHN